MTEICEKKGFISKDKNAILISNMAYKKLEQIAKAFNTSFENCISMFLKADLEYLRLALKNNTIDDVKAYYNILEINPNELKKAFLK